MDRPFVPLNTKSYKDFKFHGKMKSISAGSNPGGGINGFRKIC